MMKMQIHSKESVRLIIAKTQRQSKNRELITKLQSPFKKRSQY